MRSNLNSVFKIIELIGLLSIKTSNRLDETSVSIPEAEVEFFCESKSINKTFLDAADNEAARFNAVVVLPTPPF